jgi:predicted ribosomally synthesized six-cysteine peptide SCIFF
MENQRKHVKTVSEGTLSHQEGTGCGECQASCQSACKTSCTVANQQCAQKGSGYVGAKKDTPTYWFLIV